MVLSFELKQIANIISIFSGISMESRLSTTFKLSRYIISRYLLSMPTSKELDLTAEDVI